MALIGVDATLANTPYEKVVSLGILGVTGVAVVLGVTAGRLAKASHHDLT
jgi:hypothetical protein